MKKITARIISGENTIYIYNNIDSAEIESLTKGDLSNIIDYGIYSNKGTLSFFDYDKSFYNLMETSPTTIEVKAYVSNPVADKLIGTFLIDDYDYDDETKLVSLTLKDNLLSWQNIELPVLYYYYGTPLYNIVDNIRILGGLPSLNFTSRCELRLKSIYIYCTFLENETVWSAITKICQVAMCRVCTDENGIPTFYTDDVTSSDNIIIRSRNILSIDNEIYRRQNKIDNGVLILKSRTREANKVHSIQVTPYKLANDEAVFVGKDTSQNINATISVVDNNSDTQIDHKVETTLEFQNNVYEVYGVSGDIFAQTRAGSQYKYNGFSNYRDLSATRQDNSLIFDISFLATFAFNRDNIWYYATSANVDFWGYYYKDNEEEKFYPEDSNLNSIPTNFNSNELMQTENYMNENMSIKYYTWFLERIQRYKNGVNCCEMDCLATDYYGENNELIINGNRKNGQVDTFAKQDVVVPYVTRNGVEQPYRTTADGSPIAFTVVGIKYLYNGHLTQKIMLQEKT